MSLVELQLKLQGDLWIICTMIEYSMTECEIKSQFQIVN